LMYFIMISKDTKNPPYNQIFFGEILPFGVLIYIFPHGGKS
jgi:hypothetical protein